MNAVTLIDTALPAVFAPTDPDRAEYDSQAECRRRWPNLHANRLYRGAALGLIRTRVNPGVAIRYHRGDVERFVADSPSRRRGA